MSDRSADDVVTDSAVGPGVRHRRRVGAEPDDHPALVVVGQVDHGVRERLPLEVRLGADQQQHVVAVGVGAGAQLDRRPGQPGDEAVDQVHDRPSGPVVEQPVGVELGDDLGPGGRQQRGHGVGGAGARVDPAVHRHDHHRLVELGCEVDLDQWIVAHETSPAAVWVSSPRWSSIPRKPLTVSTGTSPIAPPA